MRIEVIRKRGSSLFAADPDLLEQMIEANFVLGGWIATVRGVGQGAGQRMTRAVLSGVEMETTVREFDAAICLTRDVGIVRDHQNGVPVS